MRRKLLLVFLLVLYIGPIIFTSSYVPSAIVVESNSTKEFQTATEYGTSDQSITSFSEETGWIHDCSNTTGITNTTAGDTVTSDGDWITLTSDGDGGSFEITVSSLTTADYPFLSLNFTSISEGDGWKLEVYNGSVWANLQSDYATTTGIYRYNMKAVSNLVETFRINVTQTATVKFDFFYAYTIANWSITQKSTTPVSHYFYCEDGVLYRVGSATSQYWIVLTLDIAISVSSPPYTTWNITVSDSDPTPRADFIFQTYIDPDWTTHDTDATQGDMPVGTTTEIALYIYNENSLSAITFSGLVPSWEEVGEAILYFNVPFDYWALNMGLVFGGLIIMLVSTCLIAVKVRDRTITRDAGILLLFLFCVGWGLFIGGTLIG